MDGLGGGGRSVGDEGYQRTVVIVGYLERQTAAGRLRQVDPVLVMRGFLAPLTLHAVSRPAGLVEEPSRTSTGPVV